MTEPAAYDEKTVPAVPLGEQLWPIPHLVPRQYREIWEDLIAVTAALDEALPTPEDGAPNDLPERLMHLSTEIFKKLQYCVFWGLRRAHPNLTEAEFLDMDIQPPQMVHAFLVTRAQSRMYRPKDEAAAEGGRPGEENGAQAP
jgi:hypothetical protein